MDRQSVNFPKYIPYDDLELRKAEWLLLGYQSCMVKDRPDRLAVYEEYKNSKWLVHKYKKVDGGWKLITNWVDY